MPKFAAHILIAELAAAKRPDLFDGEPASNALRLGAVGPDLTLFLFDPVTKPEIRKGFEIAVSVLFEMRKIKDAINKVAEELKRPVDDIADWLSGGLSKDLTATLELSIELMLTSAKLGLAVGTTSLNLDNPLAKMIANGTFDKDLLKDPSHALPNLVVRSTDNFGFPFRYFGHPYTDDGDWKKPLPVGDYGEWWWMDMLHYRKTGAFALALEQHATDKVTHAYAKGYMSHVAGDICGHPYINALVHGPFRNHAYRHIVLEGLVDTWLWDRENRGDIITSDLHHSLALSEADLDSVANQIVNAMKTTYQGDMVPNQLPGRYPSTGEIKAAYKLMQTYLYLSTSGGMTMPQPPPDDPGEVLKEIQDLLGRNTPGQPPNYDPQDALASLIAIIGWLLKGVTYLAMLATLPAAVMTRFLTMAPRWVIYIINLALYMIISGLRSLLAMMGWGYAGRDDFSNFGFLKDLIRVNADYVNQYPYAGNKKPEQGKPPNPKVPFYWMVPPRFFSEIEEPKTRPIPPTQGGPMPDWILSPSNAMDRGGIDALLAAKTPLETRNLVGQLQDNGGFGNAVDFLIYLLDGGIPVPDLDLDGDRGYAYKPWEELPPNERYV